jgi:hypothetical protein
VLGSICFEKRLTKVYELTKEYCKEGMPGEFFDIRCLTSVGYRMRCSYK